jgi:hypothetical protein
MADAADSEPRFILSRMSLDGSAPDLLGISQISGWYGPGAWTAFLCFTIASWIRASRDWTSRLETNTWMLLLATNCAAIDLTLRIAELKRESMSDDEEVISKQLLSLGRLATGLMITYWGTLHATLQLGALVAVKSFRKQDHASSTALILRISTIFIGVQFPAVVLCSFLRLYSLEIDKQKMVLLLPALYVHGADENKLSYLTIGVLGLAIVSASLLLLSWAFVSWFQRSNINMRRSSRRMKTPLPTWLADLSLVLFGMLPPFAVAATAMFAVQCILTELLLYFIGLLSHPCQHWTGSCFFMPCTAHSVGDMDQAFGLVAGLIMLLGPDIILPFARRRLRGRNLRVRIEDLVVSAWDHLGRTPPWNEPLLGASKRTD